jgi:hypothetical protein
MKILWKLEQDFNDSLENAKNRAMYDEITIEELLDLGFNNNYLMLSNGEEIELGYIDENGERSEELTEEQLSVKVYMKEDFGWYSDEDTDGDGYHIAKVYCLDKNDEKLFMEAE